MSHAILKANRKRTSRLADGICVTPSHNPPRDGGFKYNPPNGGPADSDATSVIAARANDILAGGLTDVKRMDYQSAKNADTTGYFDYTAELRRRPGERARHRRDPVSRACTSARTRWAAPSVGYWAAIAERLHLDLTVLNDRRRSRPGRS